MKLKNLIEIELGSDPEHEKIIKNREETLLKKIKRKQEEKRKSLKGYETKSRFEEQKPIVELKRKGIFKEIFEFNKFVLNKIRIYIDTKSEIPFGSNFEIESIRDFLLSRIAINISKNKIKMIQDIIKVMKTAKRLDPETEEGVEMIQGMFVTPEIELHQHFRDVVGKRYADLDLKDLEEWINNLPKDSEVKTKIDKFNRTISRMSEILAVNKYLSNVPSDKKVIKISPRK